MTVVLKIKPLALNAVNAEHGPEQHLTALRERKCNELAEKSNLYSNND